jgi:hypothetical protein
LCFEDYVVGLVRLSFSLLLHLDLPPLRHQCSFPHHRAVLVAQVVAADLLHLNQGDAQILQIL